MSYLDCSLPCVPAVKPVRAYWYWYSAPVAVLQAFGHTSTEAESVLLSVVGMGGAVLGKEGRKLKCDFAAVIASDFLALFPQ